MTKAKLLGQVFTPELIAIKMAKIIIDNTKFEKIKLLDPCIGPATFLKAFRTVDNSKSNSYYGFDIDSEMINYSREYSKNTNFQVFLESTDYLLENIEFKPNAIIMNPPYIRHEWISRDLKDKYRKNIETMYNTKVDGRSNLFIYFFLKSFFELEENGLICILVYDAILSTTYGKKALSMILNDSEIVFRDHIKTPFNNVLVDASLLVLRKQTKKETITDNIVNNENQCFISLEKLAMLKRGTGLINSKLFLANNRQKYFNKSKQFLKKQLSNDLIISKNEIKQCAYLFEQNEVLDVDFLQWFTQYAQDFCNENLNVMTLKSKINSNEKWYCHKTFSAPILFNYYIRNNPRFIRNVDNIPFSDNFYGIFPYGEDTDYAWLLLNTPIYLKFIMNSSRNQGNGLKKIQLTELKKVLVPNWNRFSSQDKLLLKELSITLKHTKNFEPILSQANEIIKKYI